MRSQNSKPFYVTTPLYYVNAAPHLGHACATLLADTLQRFHRQKGEETRMLTGTDEHGDKIANMAAQVNLDPKSFSDNISEKFQSAWNKIGIQPSVFYRTTQQSHYKLVSEALRYLKNKGEIYFGSYSGKYCVGCERFRTDQEWNEQGLCPDHLTPPEMRQESNYFFKMSAYQERLIEFYRKNPEVIQPHFYLNEVLKFLEQPLEDLNVSRPISRLKWGIPLPFDENYVTYVWFDALLSYLGGLGYQGSPEAPHTHFQKDFWNHSTQLIGKDILKTHAIYWPTMLMALGLEPFKQLQVSGFWLVNNQKMSKSLGNVVEPVKVHETFGIESLRYFLLREASFGSDATFSYESLVERSNADLANGIGNLSSRVLTLVKKNLNSKVPSKKSRNSDDESFLKTVHALPEAFVQEMEQCRYHRAMALFSESVAISDRYINDNKPWALAKDPTQHDRLEAVLGSSMDALYTLSVVMASVLPEAMQKLRMTLGQSPELPGFNQATETLAEGTLIGEVPRLFPRLELPKGEAP